MTYWHYHFSLSFPLQLTPSLESTEIWHTGPKQEQVGNWYNVATRLVTELTEPYIATENIVHVVEFCCSVKVGKSELKTTAHFWLVNIFTNMVHVFSFQEMASPVNPKLLHLDASAPTSTVVLYMFNLVKCKRITCVMQNWLIKTPPTRTLKSCVAAQTHKTIKIEKQNSHNVRLRAPEETLKSVSAVRVQQRRWCPQTKLCWGCNM